MSKARELASALATTLGYLNMANAEAEDRAREYRASHPRQPTGPTKAVKRKRKMIKDSKRKNHR